MPPKSGLHDLFESPIGLNVGIQGSAPPNLLLYVEPTIARLEAQNFQLIESNPGATLAGNNSAYEMIYTASGQKSMAIFTIKNNSLYRVSISHLQKTSLFICQSYIE